MFGKGKSWACEEAWKEDGPSLFGHQLAFTLFHKVHKCYVMARSQSMSRNNLCPDRGTKSDCEDSRQGGLSQKRCVRRTPRGRQRSASTSFTHERMT